MRPRAAQATLGARAKPLGARLFLTDYRRKPDDPPQKQKMKF